MSVQGWNVGEIYEDKHGGRWLVTSGCREPTVTMQRIMPIWGDNPIAPSSQTGGVSGLIWDGFKKIADAPEPRVATNHPIPSE